MRCCSSSDKIVLYHSDIIVHSTGNNYGNRDEANRDEVNSELPQPDINIQSHVADELVSALIALASISSSLHWTVEWSV